jgi:hypothetical protein
LNRGLSAAFACAVQEFTGRMERWPEDDDPGDPRVLVPVPVPLGALIAAGQQRGELGDRRQPLDLAEQITFLLSCPASPPRRGC